MARKASARSSRRAAADLLLHGAQSVHDQRWIKLVDSLPDGRFNDLRRLRRASVNHDAGGMLRLEVGQVDGAAHIACAGRYV